MTPNDYVRTILDLTIRLNAALDVIQVLLNRGTGPSPDDLTPEQEQAIQDAITQATLRAEAMEVGGGSGSVSVSPNSGAPGSTVQAIVTGSGFIPGVTGVTVNGTGVAVGAVTVLNPTSLTVQLTIDAAALAGPYLLTVTTNGVGFTVQFSVSGVTSGTFTITPVTGAPGSSGPITVTGPNLGSGTALEIDGTGVTLAGPFSSAPDSFSGFLTVDINAVPGPRTVKITKNGNPVGTVEFTVEEATASNRPVILSISPARAVPGSTTTIAITGQNFTADAVLAINGVGAHGAVIAESPTTITAQFIIDASAAVGERQVTVSNSIGTSDPVIFTVAT